MNKEYQEGSASPVKPGEATKSDEEAPKTQEEPDKTKDEAPKSEDGAASPRNEAVPSTGNGEKPGEASKSDEEAPKTREEPDKTKDEASKPGDKAPKSEDGVAPPLNEAVPSTGNGEKPGEASKSDEEAPKTREEPDKTKDEASKPRDKAPKSEDGVAPPLNEAVPLTGDGEKDLLPDDFREPWPMALKPEEIEKAAVQTTDSTASQLLTSYSDEKDILKIVTEFNRKFADRKEDSWLFLDAEEYSHVWAVGDVHASVDSLARICALLQQKVEAMEGKHALVLLGDILDRGEKTAETVAFTCNLLMEHLGMDNLKVFYIRGNHDVGLYRKEDGTYASRVSPSESADCLNRLLREEKQQYADAVANAAMLLARISPCMMELRGFNSQCPARSIMLVHGGVPHTDLQDKIKNSMGHYFPGSPEMKELEKEVMEDFTWIRLVAALPRKRPNRCGKGSEMGTEDVNKFRELYYKITGRIISYIIRGHDHHKKGYELYSYDEKSNHCNKTYVQKNCGVLTINAMEKADAITLAYLHKDMEAVYLYVMPNKPSLA